MKINYALVCRSLIALLFVVAGIQKLMNYSNTTSDFAGFGIPVPFLAVLIVIIIEIPVALAFAWGYKVKEAGYALIAFTALATILVHRDLAGAGGGLNMVMALKNIAIIGGIMAAISCACGDCSVHAKKHAHHEPQA